MYPIDLATCTAVDVIERSLVCHPTAFADALKAARRNHYQYADKPGPGQAGAFAAGRACQSAFAIATDDGEPRDKAERMAQDVGTIVQAFTVAAELNLIPRHMRADIIGRTPTATAT